MRKIRSAFASLAFLGVLACAGAGVVPSEDPVTPERLIFEGDLLFRNGDLAGALEAYRAYLAQEDDSSHADEALYRVGLMIVYLKPSGGFSDESQKALQKLVQDFPESPRVLEARNLLKMMKSARGEKAENEKLQAELQKLRTDLQKLLDLDIQSERQRKALE